MYCQKCGTEVSNEATFCRNCGALIKQQDIDTMIDASKLSNQQKQLEAEKQKQKEKKEIQQRRQEQKQKFIETGHQIDTKARTCANTFSMIAVVISVMTGVVTLFLPLIRHDNSYTNIVLITQLSGIIELLILIAFTITYYTKRYIANLILAVAYMVLDIFLLSNIVGGKGEGTAMASFIFMFYFTVSQIFLLWRKKKNSR